MISSQDFRLIRSAKVRPLATLKDPYAMIRLTRRSFLAACTAVAAEPAWGAPRLLPAPDVPRSGNVDVIIVGAGAAGIAAARRLAAAGRRFALPEAADRIGGQCITDNKTFDVPYDR